MTARRPPGSEAELEDLLSEPRAQTIAALAANDGDVLVLGAGGKMGPTLARMAARASELAGRGQRVIAVSRFGSALAEHGLRAANVTTIRADLRDPRALEQLPDAPNIIFMAGQKFGTREAPANTWIENVVLPARCADRWPGARIVVFSTGNVYPLVPADGGGATEATSVAPVGEYAASCLGRERVFEFAANASGTRVAILRLNYAVDLRYGVLTDLAVAVANGTTVDLAMGHVNVIWQGDANRVALELLASASTPATVLNVTGTATLSVRALATALGERLGRAPRFEGRESADALLSNASVMRSRFGEPAVSIDTMLDWTAFWVRNGLPLLGKPTHFATRDGRF